MKVAYLVHFRGGGESGILRKVASQAAAWTRLGADVGVFVSTAPDSVGAWRALPETRQVVTPPGGPLALFREREALLRQAEAWQPDVVYTRHGLTYPGLVRLAFRRPCIVEVNGDDLAEARLRSAMRYHATQATRGALLRRAAGLVFVTNELSVKPSFAGYRRPYSVISNGIDLASMEIQPAPANTQPRLLFLGHPDTAWHGLDQIVELASTRPHWHFDIVGPSPSELPGSSTNVDVVGALNSAEYAPLLAQADVAIGTLGLYRKDMHEACPLKVREYLAAGVPAIIGYQDTDFMEGADFLLRIPNGPGAVRASLDDIDHFVHRWRGQRVPRQAIGHLDASVKEQARLDFIQGLING